MSEEEERVTEWLGETGEAAGREWALTDEIVETLVKGYQEGIWDSDDVLEDKVPEQVLVKEHLPLWIANFKDSAALQKDRKVGDRELLQLTRWLKARFVDVALDAVQDEQAPTQLSEKSRAAMKEQGVLRVEQIGQIEGAYALGRYVTNAECKGFQMGTPWTSLPCAKMVLKQGEPTFDKILVKALLEQSMSGIDEHLEDLVKSLLENKGDELAMSFMARLLQSMQAIRSAFNGHEPMMVAYYKQRRRESLGLGLTSILDDRIVSSCMARCIALPTAGPAKPAIFSAPVGKVAQVGGQVPPSAPLGSGGLADILEAIAASTALVTNTATAVGLLSERMQFVESKVNLLQKTSTSRECYFCGDSGHMIGNCPQNRNADGSQKPAPKKP